MRSLWCGSSGLLAVQRRRLFDGLQQCGGVGQVEFHVYADRPRTEPLNAAEKALVAMAARGATGNEIAARLDRSPETVRTHLKRAYTALGISSRTQLGIVVRSLTRAGAVDAPA